MSPLRILVKSHAERLITKDEYHHVRTLLLDKLEKTGRITTSDLDNFLNLKNVDKNNSSKNSYEFSDIIIAILGLCAAATLAYILYS